MATKEFTPFIIFYFTYTFTCDDSKNMKQSISRETTYESLMSPSYALQQMKRNVPLPITISGTNNVTFSLNCSVTEKHGFVLGSMFIFLTRALSYTWVAGANNAILNADGEYKTEQSPATGIWYFYVGKDIAGDSGTENAILLLPSQTPPSYVEDDYNSGHLSHPGLKKTTSWNYVGWVRCNNSSTPTFVACEKIGYDYLFAAQTQNSTTSWAELAFVLPKLGSLGGKAFGYFKAGTSGTLTIGSTSTEGRGVVVTDGTDYKPFGNIAVTPNGKIYAKHATAAGEVNVTGFVDIV